MIDFDTESMLFPLLSTFAVWVSPLVVKEMKRIIESSEIVKEEDTNWPKKNIVGKQELEIRIGNDHISFEVRRDICCIAALS